MMILYLSIASLQKMSLVGKIDMNQGSSYIIGETAYNHEGDIRFLYRMVDDIAELKLDAIKFHLLLNPLSYMQKDHPLMERVKSWIFSEDEWIKILRYSKEKGLDVIALCDDLESLLMINSRCLDVDMVELHAVTLSDWFLLKEAARFRKKIILGIGGTSTDEIKYAIDLLKENDKTDIFLMYGFQNYPTDYSDLNFSRMLEMGCMFKLPIGYADHTAFDDDNNEYISSLCAAFGINVLEKHYTPYPGGKRVDYEAAIGKDKIQKIRKYMDLALKVYGGSDKEMSKSELKYGTVGPMKKAIVAKKDIKKGEKFSLDNLCFKRTKEESNLKAMDFLKVIGLKAAEDIREDELIDLSKARQD